MAGDVHGVGLIHLFEEVSQFVGLEERCEQRLGFRLEVRQISAASAECNPQILGCGIRISGSQEYVHLLDGILHFDGIDHDKPPLARKAQLDPATTRGDIARRVHRQYGQSAPGQGRSKPARPVNWINCVREAIAGRMRSKRPSSREGPGANEH